MKRKDAGFIIILLCALGLVAWADVTTTVGSVADTWIQDANSIHGSDDYIGITGPAGGEAYTMGYLRFDLRSLNIETISDASLSLVYYPRPNASNYGLHDNPARFALQGLDNVAGNTPQDWDEAALNQSNTGLEVDWPANTGQLVAGRFTDLDDDIAGITEALVWNEPWATNGDYYSAGNTTATISGAPLVAFLNSRVDGGGLVTFVISGDRGYGLGTKENATEAYRPVLTLTYTFAGADAPQPANGAAVNKDSLTQLSWTLTPPGTIGKCDVYFGTEPNVLTMDKLTYEPAVSSVNINDFPNFDAPLNAGTYYWRVDCYKGSPLPAEPNLLGSYWSFEATALPAITQQTTPTYQAMFAAETAVFTVGFTSSTPITYTWYHSSDNANNTPGDDVAVGGDSDTLTLTNLTAADAGYYFCKAANPGEVSTNPARLSIKQQYVHLALDGDASDSSGNGLDGTLFGTPVFDTGMISQAMLFDGTDDYIQVPSDFADFTPGATIVVWAKPSAVTNWARFIDFGTGAPGDNIYLSRNGTSNNLSFVVYTGTTSAGTITANNAIALNEWQMFVATLDASRNVVLYKNGVSAGTGTLSQMPVIITRTSNLIGDSNWTADAFYNGMMDDIQILNYPKSADDVANMYAGVVGNFCRTKPTYDLSGDCKTNLADFAMIAAQWLDCGMFPECP